MKTYVINSIEDLEQFEGDGGYNVDGNLEVNCSLYIQKRLIIDGYLFIKADRSIEAGGSIKAGEYIEAGGYIETGGSIKAGGYIKAGRYIEAGGSIKAGDKYGISAGLFITCKTTISFGLKAFAGICTWREITDEEKTITCGKFEGGEIGYGILVETGVNNDGKTH